MSASQPRPKGSNDLYHPQFRKDKRQQLADWILRNSEGIVAIFVVEVFLDFVSCFLYLLERSIDHEGDVGNAYGDRPSGIYWIQLCVGLGYLLLLSLKIFMDSTLPIWRKMMSIYVFSDLVCSIPFVVFLFHPPWRAIYIPTFIRCWNMRRSVARFLSQRSSHTNQSHALQHEEVSLMLTIGSFVFTSMCGIEYIETSFGIEDMTIFEGLYFTVITFSTVGYGDLSPTSVLGRVFVIFIIIAAISVLPSQIDRVNSVRSAQKETGGVFTPASHGGAHVVVVGGTLLFSPLRDFLHEFFAEQRIYHKVSVVFLSTQTPDAATKEMLRTPVWRQRARWLVGTPMSNYDLRRARVREALAVFLIAERTGTPHLEQDNRTVMRLWAIKDYSPTAHVFLHAFERPSMSNMRMAHQRVCEGELLAAFLSISCRVPGASTLLTNLIHTSRPPSSDTKMPRWMGEYFNGWGNELYMATISDRATIFSVERCVGKSFLFVVRTVYRDFGLCVIGIKRGSEAFRLNPGEDLILKESDVVAYIGQTNEFEMNFEQIARGRAAEASAAAATAATPTEGRQETTAAAVVAPVKKGGDGGGGRGRGKTKGADLMEMVGTIKVETSASDGLNVTEKGPSDNDSDVEGGNLLSLCQALKASSTPDHSSAVVKGDKEANSTGSSSTHGRETATPSEAPTALSDVLLSRFSTPAFPTGSRPNSMLVDQQTIARHSHHHIQEQQQQTAGGGVALTTEPAGLCDVLRRRPETSKCTVGPVRRDPFIGARRRVVYMVPSNEEVSILERPVPKQLRGHIVLIVRGASEAYATRVHTFVQLMRLEALFESDLKTIAIVFEESPPTELVSSLSCFPFVYAAVGDALSHEIFVKLHLPEACDIVVLASQEHSTEADGQQYQSDGRTIAVVHRLRQTLNQYSEQTGSDLGNPLALDPITELCHRDNMRFLSDEFMTAPVDDTTSEYYDPATEERQQLFHMHSQHMTASSAERLLDGHTPAVLPPVSSFASQHTRTRWDSGHRDDNDDDDDDDDDDTSSRMISVERLWMTQRKYVRGRVMSASMLDVLLYQAFYNPFLIEVVESLVGIATTRSKTDVHLSEQPGHHPEGILGDQWVVHSGLLDTITLDNNIVERLETYGSLHSYLAKTYGVIAIGLFRTRPSPHQTSFSSSTVASGRATARGGTSWLRSLLITLRCIQPDTLDTDPRPQPRRRHHHHHVSCWSSVLPWCRCSCTHYDNNDDPNNHAHRETSNVSSSLHHRQGVRRRGRARPIDNTVGKHDFVFTNPPPSQLLNSSDRVYIIRMPTTNAHQDTTVVGSTYAGWESIPTVGQAQDEASDPIVESNV